MSEKRCQGDEGEGVKMFMKRRKIHLAGKQDGSGASKDKAKMSDGHICLSCIMFTFGSPWHDHIRAFARGGILICVRLVSFSMA